ncbi:putative Secretin_N domain-containing protein [Gammaproteobacteria bacterium]
MSKAWVGRCGCRSLVVGTFFFGLLRGVDGWAADIQWRNEPFERQVVEEDLRDVLSRLLRQNNPAMVLVFKPGIIGKVTTDFKSMNIPLQGAFNKLMEENLLSYSFDEKDNKLTIFPTVVSKRVLIPLNYMSPGEVKAALGRFRLLDKDVSVILDDKTNALLLNGTSQIVSEIEGTIAKLEAGAAERHKNAENMSKIRESEAKLRESEAKMRESDSKLREQAVFMRERELRVKCAEEQAAALMSRQVEVIPVRYASVGNTTLSFQGKDVSVPGIDVSLRSLLEDPTEKKHPSNKDSKTQIVLSSAESSSITADAVNNNHQMPCGNIKPVISIDLRTNSVVIQAPPDVIADVKKMIKALDKPMPLIDLEVMIVQAESGTSRNLGVQWGAATSESNGTAIGVSTGGGAGALAAGAAANIAAFNGTPMSRGSTGIIDKDGNVISKSNTSSGPGYSNSSQYTAQTSTGTTGTSTIGYTVQNTSSITPIADPITLLPLVGGPGNGLLSYIFQGSRVALAAQINALKEQGKGQILASPHVVTLNNVLAKVTSKRKVSIPITTGDGTRSDIKSIDAGLEMQITPSLIIEDSPGSKNMVRLNINAKNSSFTAVMETDEKEVQTNVVIPEGNTFILGGLFQDVRNETESGVAGLMNLPVVGGLFRSKSSNLTRAETIFFITPKLVDHKTMTAHDVGARDYMYHQKASLEEDRRSLQSHSGRTRRVVEDE